MRILVPYSLVCTELLQKRHEDMKQDLHWTVVNLQEVFPLEISINESWTKSWHKI